MDRRSLTDSQESVLCRRGASSPPATARWAFYGSKQTFALYFKRHVYVFMALQKFYDSGPSASAALCLLCLHNHRIET